jgi:hypothetical protein
VEKRLQAPKSLIPAETGLTPDDKLYARILTSEILRRYVPGDLTLVVVNRVTRTQQVYQGLINAGRTADTTGLVHSRFRESDPKLKQDKAEEKGRQALDKLSLPYRFDAQVGLSGNGPQDSRLEGLSRIIGGVLALRLQDPNLNIGCYRSNYA